jgi:hypothetical protein
MCLGCKFKWEAGFEDSVIIRDLTPMHKYLTETLLSCQDVSLMGVLIHNIKQISRALAHFKPVFDAVEAQQSQPPYRLDMAS